MQSAEPGPSGWPDIWAGWWKWRWWVFVTVFWQLKNASWMIQRRRVMALWDVNVKVSMCSLLLVYIKKNRRWNSCYTMVISSSKEWIEEWRSVWYIITTVPRPLGELSLDEFIDGARRDKWVMKMLQMDVNPGDWIKERSGSTDC